MKTRIGNTIIIFVLFAACRGKYLRDFEPNEEEQLDEIVEPERVTAGIESSFGPNLSPNGAFVLYTSDRKGNKDIWEKKTNGGYPIQLTNHPADDFAPIISPDGEYAAFISRRENALGDVHVLELGASFSKLLGKYEGKVYRIESEKTDDNWPAWFSDSERLVFAARRIGEAESKLYTVGISELQPQPLEGLAGEQPAVSPDDQFIAYVRQGNIWLYDLQKKKQYKMTDAKGIQDGQPSFTPDGKGLVFLRYSEDTNQDGLLDADDRATIWQLDIAKQIKSQNKPENFLHLQLTRSSYSAFRPSVRPPFLFFARQDRDGVDIFRLPAGGEITKLSTLDQALNYINEAGNTEERIFILRHAQARMAMQSKWQEVARLAISELELLLAHNRLTEAEWLSAKLKMSFPKNKVLHLYASLFIEELRIKPLLFGETSIQLTLSEEATLKKSLARLKRIVKRFSAPEYNEVNLRAKLLAAKIHASLGAFAVADKQLEQLLDSDPNRESFNVAKSGLFRAHLTSKIVGLQEGIRGTIEVARLYQSLQLIVEEAAKQAIKLSGLASNEIASLQSQIAESKELMPYPAIIHEKIVEIHAENNRELVASNELKEMMTSYGNSPGFYMRAGEKLAAFYEKSNRIDEAEAVYKEMVDSLAKDKKRARRARNMLSAFYLRKAERFIGQRDPRRAEKEYRRVLKQDWRNVSAHVGLIDSLFLQGKLEQKLEEYRLLYEEKPRDPRRIFYYAYAKSYDLKNMTDDETRNKLIDECIVLLEEARQRNGQIAEIHQTLGSLYFNKGLLKEKYFAKNSFGAKLAKSWSLFKDYWGAGDPIWYEQTVDSYLSAYFTAKEDSVTRAVLSEKLGDTFFRLQNYSKSLFYYMRRLKVAGRTPIRSAAIEAKIYRLAGKSAFYTENLDVAEALQRREVQVWQKIANDEGVARAMDSLALTLREAGKYSEAYALYQELLKLQSGLKNPDNIIQTLINLGYSANETGEYEAALAHLAKAEARLTKGSERSEKGEEGTIALDLAGQGSDAKGFDGTTQMILVHTVRVDIYSKMRRYDLALKSQTQKYETMLVKQQKGQEAGKADSYYAEEISISLNHLGELQARQADYDGARQSFLAAADVATKMRPPDRDYPTRAESVNLINYGRIILRMQGLNLINRPELRVANERLTQARTELEVGFKKGDATVGRPLATLSLITGKIKPGDPKLIGRSRALFAQVGGDPDELAETMLAYDFSQLKNTDKEWRSSFRRTFLSDLELSFKLYAKMGLWKNAFDSAADHIASGQGLAYPTDRKLFQDSFEAASLSLPLGSDERKVLLYRYLDHRAYEFGIRGALGPGADAEKAEKLAILFAFDRHKDNTAISDYLEDGQGLLVTHQYQDKRWVSYLHLRSGMFSALGESGEDPARGIANLLQRAGGVRDLMVVASGGARAYLWKSIAKASNIEGLTFVGSPALARAHVDKRTVPKASILHLVDGKPASTKRIAQSNKERYYRNLTVPPKSGQEQFNIVHHDYQLVLNDIEPFYSVIALDKDSKEVWNFTDLANQTLDATGLYVFPSSSKSSLAADQSWITLEIAGLMAGVSTLIVAGEERSDPWQKFYSDLNTQTYAAAFAASGVEGFMIGFPGVSPQFELTYAADRISDLVVEGEQALRQRAYSEAASAYKEAVYYAKRLGRSKEEQKLLQNLIEALFLKRDYSFALKFQEQIIAEAAKTSDSERLGQEYLSGSILALQAKELQTSRKFLNAAKQIFTEMGDANLRERLLLHEADLLASEGQPGKAVQLLEREASVIDPVKLAENRLRLSLNDAGLAGQAIALAESYINQGLVSDRLVELYLDLLVATGREGTALAFLDSAHRDRVPVARAAHIYGMSGWFREAEQIITSGLSSTPESSELKLARAELHMRQRDYQRALKDMLELYFGDEAADQSVKARLARLIGICHEQIGNLSSAESFYQTALQMSESIDDRLLRAQASYDYGRLKLSASRLSAAVEEFEKSVQFAESVYDHELRIKAMIALDVSKTLASEESDAANQAYQLAVAFGHQRLQWQSALLLAKSNRLNAAVRQKARKSFMNAVSVIELRSQNDALSQEISSEAFVASILPTVKTKEQRLRLVDTYHSKTLPGYKVSSEGILSKLTQPGICFLELLQTDEKLYRFFISSAGLQENVSDLSRSEADDAVTEYISILANFANTSLSEARLNELIFSNLDLGGCRHLIVTADRAWHYVSLRQLPAATQNDVQILYTPSLSSLVENRTDLASAPPDGASVIAGSGDLKSYLVQREIEVAQRFYPKQGQDVVLDLRQEKLTGDRLQESGQGTHYFSSVSMIPHGVFYIGLRKSGDFSALSGAELHGTAGLLARNGYRVGLLTAWSFNELSAALYSKHLQRQLANGVFALDAIRNVSQKMDRRFEHPAARASAKPYIFDLSVLDMNEQKPLTQEP